MHEINMEDQATTEARATTTSTTVMPSLSMAGTTITLAGAESTFSGSTTQYGFWLVPPATQKSGPHRFHRGFTTLSSAVANGKRRAAFTEGKDER
jgi:hypothetical protein